MKKTVINFKSMDVSEEDINILKDELLLITNDSVMVNKTNSFNGFSDVIIILSIGGGVAIKQIGTIIVNWINRDKTKKIKYKGVEATGYSSDEIINILNGVTDE